MKPEGYKVAVERALEALGEVDVESQVGLCGGTYEGTSNTGCIALFNEEYVIRFPAGEVVSGDDALVRRLILLHYIGRSDGIGPSGKMVTFREVPEGNFYFHSFRDRVINPLLRDYGRDPDLLRKRLAANGWRSVDDGGDVCFETDALPLIPVRIILWLGDDELEPEATMLFDSNISHHLHTEDIALLGEVALSILQ